MTVYLDASVLVGLFTVDTFSLRATAFLKTQKTHPDCQRFCRRGVRFGSGPPRPNSGGHVKRAHGMFAQMDGWIAQSAKRLAATLFGRRKVAKLALIRCAMAILIASGVRSVKSRRRRNPCAVTTSAETISRLQ